MFLNSFLSYIFVSFMNEDNKIVEELWEDGWCQGGCHETIK